MKISIIIPSYNTKKLLAECLESISKGLTDNGGKYDYEIIVVDNGSTDGSLAIMQKSKIKYQNDNVKLKIIQNKTNLGFARAVNQGIREAKGDNILLLNSDIRVTNKAISKLIEFSEKNQNVGAVAGQLINPDGTPQASVYHFPTVWGAIKEYIFRKLGSYEKYRPSGSEPERVEAAVGAVLLISGETIKKVGLFDEKYFMYFEDLDYCRRIGRSGLSIWYLPGAEFIHHHGASGKSLSGKPNEWLIESSKIYHRPFKYYLITFVIRLGQLLGYGKK